MSAALVGCQVLLAVVFLAAALGKARRPGFAAFSDALGAFGVRRPKTRRFLAAAVPVSEAAAGVLLLVPATGRAGPLLASGLMLALTAGVARAVASGRRVSCPCFGRAGRPLGRMHLVRNLALLSVAAAALVAAGRVPPPGLTDATVVAAACGLVAGLIVTGLDDITDLFHAS
ncbi:MauE/DoxX family redox-associated membrane protein [Streptomyces sp. NPDC050256]|uniref:MauE/DoxX family redox-associated membrane protein n=1 Tax=unclassified Streptomyces TaxID=2593676 RepID=UPI0037B1E80E